MTGRSTTFRFAALVFLFQILAAAVLLFGLGAALRTQSRASAVDLAETMRDDLLATYADRGLSGLASAIETRTSRRIERSAVVLLADPGGKAIAGNLTAKPRALAASRTYRLIKVQRPGHAKAEAMFLQATRLRGGEWFVTGTVVESERQLFAQLERASLVALALSILFAGFAAFVSTRLILNRLQATIATLGSVRDGDMARRVPRDDTGDAFGLLGEEVNRTLDRVEALNAELKIATDALAHDLKSPLTRMQSALDRLGRTVRDPAALAAVDQAFAESERLLAMIETALSITRAEAGIGRESFAPTNLTEMLATIVEIYAPMVEDEGRAIVLQAPARFDLAVHRQLMDQAIGNLVDNTLKYGAGTITLSLVVHEGGATIAVADEGPGIPADKRSEALTRFSRLDQARRGWGAGLGLSLVQAVAHLHGGSVELRECAPGLEVAILLGDVARV
ncbi:HAMP domain-containing sensor histidine kinase [Novosphingobium sp. 9U]|uniref:sensor histidine kinase n=1 Tax=Novosphingobium sp. 9U TaxID=2653158 RepID=UPI0012F30848|nr:HAMP domain-containing sensor histidine kinase [Novosphingobium sp. 9U]VWX47206.1 Histidine kinase [Novosphingobium sp. 9U]